MAVFLYTFFDDMTTATTTTQTNGYASGGFVAAGVAVAVVSERACRTQSDRRRVSQRQWNGMPPPPPPARPLHSSLPPSKNADGAAHLRVPGARWSPRPGAQGRPLGGTLRKSESTIPRPVFLISVGGGKRSRRTLGAMPPLLSKGKFHLPAASNYGQLCRFRDLQLCRCTLLDRSYRLASEGDASDVPKGSIRGGGRDQVFFVRRNLTLSTFFFCFFFFLLLSQKQARPVAVQARPAAWCPGLDAPEHLTGS